MDSSMECWLRFIRLQSWLCPMAPAFFLVLQAADWLVCLVNPLAGLQSCAWLRERSSGGKRSRLGEKNLWKRRKRKELQSERGGVGSPISVKFIATIHQQPRHWSLKALCGECVASGEIGDLCRLCSWPRRNLLDKIAWRIGSKSCSIPLNAQVLCVRPAGFV